jgi:hypothetical protein
MEPVLSVVVALVSDTTGPPDCAHLEPCLAALIRQAGAPPMEILVPVLPATAGVAELRRKYPEARIFEAPDLRLYTGQPGSREHHDELRARGMAQARGRIVALIEDHGIAAEDWAARIIELHGERQGSQLRNPALTGGAEAAGIGGAIENGIDRPLNWAVYYCDFLRYQRPFPESDSWVASDANVSYERAALESVAPLWREVFHESSVNGALRGRGERIALSPAIVVYQHRQGLNFKAAMKERFVWGRSYAATRAGLAGTSKRIFWAVFAPALPVLMLARMTLMAWRKRRTMGPFIRAFPFTAALIVSWSWGEFVGYSTGRANVLGAQAAEAIARGAPNSP